MIRRWIFSPCTESYDQPTQHIKKQTHCFANKGHIVKAMVFPVVMYGCESCTMKKSKHWRTDAFELWCWRRLLRVPWTAKRSNQSILHLTFNPSLIAACPSQATLSDVSRKPTLLPISFHSSRLNSNIIPSVFLSPAKAIPFLLYSLFTQWNWSLPTQYTAKPI